MWRIGPAKSQNRTCWSPLRMFWATMPLKGPLNYRGDSVSVEPGGTWCASAGSTPMLAVVRIGSLILRTVDNRVAIGGRRLCRQSICCGADRFVTDQPFLVGFRPADL